MANEDFKDVRIYCKRQFYINCDVYRTDVKVIVTDDYIKSLKDFNEKYDEDISLNGREKSAEMFYVVSTKMYFLPHIFISTKNIRQRADDAIVSISHEALHIALFLLWWVGADADFENQEHLCYLHGFITEKVIAGIRKFVSSKKINIMATKKQLAARAKFKKMVQKKSAKKKAGKPRKANAKKKLTKKK